MAKKSIGHQPNLTADALMKSFEKHFGGKYDVFPTPEGIYHSLRNDDFIIKKSNLAAIGVRIEQKESDTNLVYHGDWPQEPPFSWFVPYRILVSVIATFAMNSVMREVGKFIDTSLRYDLEAMPRS